MNLYMNAIILAMLAGEAMAAGGAPPGPVGTCYDFINALTTLPLDKKAIKTAHSKLKTSDFDLTCFQALEAHAATDDGFIKMLKDYPNILLRAADSKGIVVTYLANKVFASLKDDVVARFFKKSMELQCGCLDTNNFGNLNYMMKKKKLAKLITPACLAEIPNLHLHDTVKNLKNLDAKIFANFESPLHENYFKEMTAEQVKYFQSNREIDDACGAGWIRLDKVKEKFWSNIQPRCAHNWLLNHVVDHQLSAKHITKVDASQFLKSDAELFDSLRYAFADDKNGKSAWLKADISLVQLFAEPDRAQYLIPAAVKADLKITARAFSEMDPAVQGRVLAKVTELPDDLFSQMSYTQIKDIVYDDEKDGKKSCEGVKCLKLIREKKNIDKIMSHIDATIAAEEPLLEFYANKDNKLIGQYLSRNSFKELEIEFADVEAHIKDLPENMLQYISTEDIKELFDHKDGACWRDLAQDYVDDKKKNRVWPGILRNPKVCARLIRMYTFDKLAKRDLMGAMDAFDSACLRVFPEFSKLPESYVRAIGDKIYEAFTKADANLIDYSKSTAAQIGNASGRVENVADHYAASLDAEGVKKVAADAWPFMNAGWFEAMSEEAYSGISEEQFSGAPAERLTRVSAGQYSHLDDKVKKSMTPEQITLIGSHGGPNSDSERAMLAAISAVSGSFNEHQVKAFKAREALTVSGAMGAASASLMALVASLAIIFPLL